ncbi:MAG: hypothetical protein B6U76_07420 [Desulfurococcales archaeon ex4484_217_2]|nr:MAG: hypothetical protein B6U76_07420 [Desulfurococcales archaeon ex4484_217_2]
MSKLPGVPRLVINGHVCVTSPDLRERGIVAYNPFDCRQRKAARVLKILHKVVKPPLLLFPSFERESTIASEDTIELLRNMAIASLLFHHAAEVCEMEGSAYYDRPNFFENLDLRSPELLREGIKSVATMQETKDPLAPSFDVVKSS